MLLVIPKYQKKYFVPLVFSLVSLVVKKTNLKERKDSHRVTISFSLFLDEEYRLRNLYAWRRDIADMKFEIFKENRGD